MVYKFVAVLAFVVVVVGVVNAGVIVPAETVVKTVLPVAPVVKTYAAQPILAKADDEYDPHPQYKFGYDVQDSLSGDSKSQVEERDGDVVRGEYSLIDADGYKRVVQYTSDAANGFNAVVNRIPLQHAVVKAGPPAVIKTASPAAYYTAAAPVVKTIAAAPVPLVKSAAIAIPTAIHH